MEAPSDKTNNTRPDLPGRRGLPEVIELCVRWYITQWPRPGTPWPVKINLDGNSAAHCGLRLLGEEDGRWRTVEVRARRYLNDAVEQDHRAIKQRPASILGLKSFRSAAITLAGVELAGAHRVRAHSGVAGSVHDGVGAMGCGLAAR